MTTLWQIAAQARQLAPTESITVPRPTGNPLTGQWPTVLQLCDSLNPSRAWLAAAGYYSEQRSGTDLGYGWQAPVVGTDAQGRPAAVLLPVPVPAPPPDTRDPAEVRASVQSQIEDEAVARFAAAVEPRYRSSAEQARWSALFSEAVTFGQTGALGPYLTAEVGGMPADQRAARIAAIRARGDAWVPYSAGVVNARSALEGGLAGAYAPWEAAMAALLDPDAVPADSVRLAVLADLDALSALVPTDAQWPVLGA
jgi:hypothetical protein